MAEERTVYVTSLHDNVDKELLEEIFTQIGPVGSVSVRSNGEQKYAFVEFLDEESVPFACLTLDGCRLHSRAIQVKPRNNTVQSQKWEEKRRSSSNNARTPQSEPRNRYNNYSGYNESYSEYNPHSRRRHDDYDTPIHVSSRHSYGSSGGNGSGRPMHSAVPYQQNDDSYNRRYRHSGNGGGSDRNGGGSADRHQSRRKVFNNSNSNNRGSRRNDNSSWR